jgi:RHS repeat-associated protein
MRSCLYILLLLLLQTTLADAQSYARTLGQKQWETANHLGNVLATTTDRKVAEPAATTTMVAAYEADVVSYQDYYPYGMGMEGRDTVPYRYGFNGVEEDNEVYDTKGSSYTTFFRQNDVRLGRWFSYDPRPNIGVSPYGMMENSPVLYRDSNGDTIRIAYKNRKGLAKIFEKKKYYSYEPGVEYKGDNAFVEKVIIALNYTFKEDEKLQVIKRLSEAKDDTRIFESRMSTYHFGIGKANDVYFNPKNGLGIHNNDDSFTGEVQSPSLFLYHELAHAFIKLFYTEKQKQEMNSRFFSSDRDIYDKAEEKEIILKFETQMAKALGQPSRTNHRGENIDIDNANEFKIKK